MDKKVSIIIVNWNGRKWLEKCLHSLGAQTYTNFEIIFVDNASSDDSVAYVRKYFPEVKIVETGSNLGFAGGNNAGIKVAEGELILLLNNDTWIQKDYLTRLHDYYIKTGCDIVGPNEANYDGQHKNKYLIPTLDVLGHPLYVVYSNNNTPFFLSGVSIIFSKKFYSETCGMDENFFMYFEEIDWFWNCRLQKKTFYFAKDVTIYHAGAGSTGYGIKYNSFLWRNQNTLQMLLKNYSLANLIWVLPLYLAQNIIEMIVFFLIGKPKIAYTYLAGLGYNIKHLPRTLAKRSKVQSTRLVKDSEILAAMYKGPGKLIHLYQYIFKPHEPVQL